MRAIRTKYFGPGSRLGSRIKAIDSGEAFSERDRCLYLSWDDALNSEENHMAAARALIQKFGWKGTWHGGSLGTSMVWVCVTRDDRLSFVAE